MNENDKQLLIEYCGILKEIIGVVVPVNLNFDNVVGGLGRHTWNPALKTSTITLNPKYPTHRLICTLAHELTHSKQWQLGLMEYHGGFKRVYRGVHYEDFRKIPHHKRQWEIEATAVQKVVSRSLEILE